MKLQYGTYVHAVQEAHCGMTRTAIRHDGRDAGYRERIEVEGRLIAANQGALTTAIAALETAYASDGQDFTVFLDDGTTPTAWKLTNSTSFGGVRVVEGPVWLNEPGAYVTWHKYRLVLEADFYDASTNIISYVETLEFWGGGPRRVMVELLEERAQPQELTRYTAFRASQSGQSVGRQSFIDYPAPKWPAAENQEARRQTPSGPERLGNTVTNFRRSWSYEFASGFPLTGNPNYAA